VTTLGELGPRLEEIFKSRNERIMFVKGDPDTIFADVAAVIDVAKGAGIDKIGLITKAIEEGQ
jgi:biopolymer transport protein ExbD